MPAPWFRALRRVGLAVAAALAVAAPGGARAAGTVSALDSLAPYAAVATGLDRPRGVAVATSGVVYFTDEHKGALYVVPVGGVPHLLLGDLTKPRGLALENDDQLLLVAEKSGRHPADRGGVLLRIDTHTGASTLLGRGIRHPRGVVRGADGKIYVTGDGLRPPSDDDDNEDNDGDDQSLPGAEIGRASCRERV